MVEIEQRKDAYFPYRVGISILPCKIEFRVLVEERGEIV